MLFVINVHTNWNSRTLKKLYFVVLADGKTIARNNHNNKTLYFLNYLNEKYR